MTRWKFDTDPRDPLAWLRIPVTSKWPVFPYLVALHKDSAHRPTTAETELLISQAQMIKSTFFQPGDVEDMDKEPFDYHPRAHTLVFHKYQRDDWGYRQPSWSGGSAFAPPSPKVTTRVIGPLSLLQVMDLVWTDPFDGLDPAWRKWKKEHPDVFG